MFLNGLYILVQNFEIYILEYKHKVIRVVFLSTILLLSPPPLYFQEIFKGRGEIKWI